MPLWLFLFPAKTIAKMKMSVRLSSSLFRLSLNQWVFQTERLARIDSVVNDYIDRECFPGAVAFIARHGKIVYYKSFGMRDPATQDPMEKDDIFRIASMTKGIGQRGCYDAL